VQGIAENEKWLLMSLAALAREYGHPMLLLQGSGSSLVESPDSLGGLCG
jgi:hypothetical protein